MENNRWATTWTTSTANSMSAVPYGEWSRTTIARRKRSIPCRSAMDCSIVYFGGFGARGNPRNSAACRRRHALHSQERLWCCVVNGRRRLIEVTGNHVPFRRSGAVARRRQSHAWPTRLSPGPCAGNGSVCTTQQGFHCHAHGEQTPRGTGSHPAGSIDYTAA